jgi:hypothetical protein
MFEDHMKKNAIRGFFALALAIATMKNAVGQGTLYISSLSGTSTGTVPVGSDSWLAAAFITGANTGGYVLNSVQLGMTDSSGSPSGFTAMIYAQSGTRIGIFPGSGIATLTGSTDPITAGIYTYIAPSGTSLSASTTYFIVLTSSTPSADGAYNWNESAFPPGVENWSVGLNGVEQSANEISGWSPTAYSGIAQFAIYATAAPEPGAVGLMVVGGLVVGWRRWRARSV